MNRSIYAWAKASALLFVISVCFSAAANAQSNAAGVWKWSFTGQNGQTFESILTLKQDGEKLTGTVLGRNGTETEIKAGKIQNNTVSFEVTRERNGQSMTIKYNGTLSGDTIKGKMDFERDGQSNSRDWEAKRDQPPVNVTGLWKWSATGMDGQAMEVSLKLEQKEGKLAGTLNRRNTDTAIEEAKLSGNDISFTVTRERDGQKFVTKYAGKVTGDVIKGKMERTGGDQARTTDWEAKREQAATATGTWKWTMTRPDGQTMQRSVKLKQDGDKLTGVSVFNDNETAIEAGEVKNGEVSFQVTREFNGNKVTMKYHGKLDGDSLKGKIEGNFGGQDRSFDWDAKRDK